MAENTGVAAPAGPVDHSPSIDSFIGEMYGDYRDSGESEPETTQGTPPAATPDPAPGSEGTEPSVPTDTPSVEADPASVPDQADPTPAPDLDPFDGAQPFTYTVDKESRPFEGIQVLKDGSAIIEKPETVQHLQRIIGERDHLFAKDQASYRKYSDLERLTTWPIYSGTDPNTGKPTYVNATGAKALEARQEALSTFAGRTQFYEQSIDALTDPTKFAKFYSIFTDEQGQYGQAGAQYVLPNKEAFQELKDRAKFEGEKSAMIGRQRFADTANAPPPPPPESPAAELALPTIDAFAATYNVTGLTPEDKQALAAQFELYVRTENGTRVVDQRFLGVMKHTAALRAQQSKVAETATRATTTNAARLAAATVGKRPANAPKITPTKEPERTREDDFDDFFDKQQKAAAGALRAHTVGR